MTDVNKLKDFQVEAKVEFKDIKLKLSELLSLSPGKLVEIGNITGKNLFLFSQDKLVAKGELVTVEDKYCFLVKENLLNQEINNQEIILKPASVSTSTTQHVQGTSFEDNSFNESSNNFGASFDDSEEFSISNNDSDF